MSHLAERCSELTDDCDLVLRTRKAILSSEESARKQDRDASSASDGLGGESSASGDRIPPTPAKGEPCQNNIKYLT